MIPLDTTIQAPTISPDAKTFLQAPATVPLSIQGPQLTQAAADALNAVFAANLGPVLAQLRADLGLQVRDTTIAGVPVVVIRPKKIRRKRRKVAGVFAHGGGFALLTGHDTSAYWMAHDMGIVVYSVNYSLSPSAKFPVALNETSRVYRAVARRYRRVLVAGSSAGANLLITTVLGARRARRPAAAGFFAPLVDVRGIGDSYIANDGRDALLTRDASSKLVAAYQGLASSVDPRVSPVLADFSRGFVPTIITTGTRDLLQSDAVRFYRVLHDAGVKVQLQVWEGMWHGFEGVPPGLPEGRQNLSEVFTFLESHI